MDKRDRYFKSVTAILGIAVFLGISVLPAGALGSTKKILAYIQYSDNTGTGEYQHTLSAIRSVSTDFVLTELTNYTQLSSVLPGQDVLLIPEQENATNSALQSIGVAWASILENFLNNGGVVIQCDFYGRYGILTGAGLMSISSSTSSTSGQTVTIVAPADPVAQGVASPYTAVNGSSYYTTTEGVVVVERSGYGPVVINKQIGYGNLVLIGHDYFSSNSNQDRIVGNAVFNLPMPFDDLQIDPDAAFLGTGPEGGPFSPTSKTYTLTNNGTSSLQWSASWSQPWLDVSAVGGTLAPSDSITVDLNLNTAANILSPGTYDDNVIFTNVTSGNSQTRNVQLTIGPKQTKLLASDGSAGDWFGISVGISSGYAIVGAKYDDDKGTDSGSAYIFQHTSGGWDQQAKLVPSDGYASDFFGFSAVINGDYAIVGAYRDDDKGTDSGSAYIFQRSGGGWVQQAKLVPSDGYIDDEFGISVGISGDYAIVGALYDDDKGTDSGSAYIFQWTGGGWVQQAKLVPSDGYTGDYFGFSVAISGDYAIVGARHDDDKGTDSGSAYIFQRSGSGWVQQAKLVPSDGYTGDYFGFSVAISGDYAIVGSYLDDDKGTDSGSAYIFQWSGSGWVQQAKLLAADGSAGDNFGFSVSIDGDNAIVGSYGDDDKGADSGSAYTFQRSGGSWVEMNKLVPSDGNVSDNFGRAVAISGEVSIVGVKFDDDKGADSGSAYVFGEADDLRVAAAIPPEDFEASGMEGGPFTPNSKQYILTNTGADPLDWMVGFTTDWLDSDSVSGTLLPGNSTTVTISLNSLAEALDDGIYHELIAFSNTTSGAATSRAVSLEVLHISGEIYVDPNSVVFGDVVVGTTSRRTVHIYNTSARQELVVSGVALAKDFPGFYDEFPETTLDPANWTITKGAPTIDSVGINEPSEPYSLRLNGNPSGGDGVETPVLDLSGLSDLEVSYWYERTGGGEHPDSGEDLVISYWNGSTWVELDRQLGGGTDMTNFVQRVIALPAGAYHAGFKLQISSTGTSGAYDDWFVDDVSIDFASAAGTGNSGNNGEGQLIVDFLPWLRLENNPDWPVVIEALESVSFDVVFEPADYKDYETTIIITSDDADEPVLEVPVSGSGIPDYMVVSPDEEVMFSGHPGGPFVPSHQYYHLTNNGPAAIDWSATVPDWLDVSPAGGSIATGNTIDVTISPNAQAAAKDVGTYTNDIIFVNNTTTFEHVRSAALVVYSHPKIWVNPTTINVIVPQEQIVSRTLTIGNTGGDSSLIFNLSSRQTDSMTIDSASSTVVLGFGLGAAVKADYKKVDFTVPAGGNYKAGELLVRYSPQVSGDGTGGLTKQMVLDNLGGGTIQKEYHLVPGLNLIKLPPGVTVEEALPLFNADASILYAQPNYEVQAWAVTPNDTYYNNLWGMHNYGQTGGTNDADIDAPEAWDIATGSRDIIVAVIDTGIDYNHPDLAANMWTNDAELHGTAGIDDDGNGYIDDIYGYDFCNNDSNPTDDHYHGTHCAGTIGAVGNNGTGVVGVCWNSRIMALKFLNSSGSGYTADAIECIQYAVIMGAKVLSNSWGGGSYDQSLKDTISAAGAAGVLFVAAAGNDGVNNDTNPHYPCSYDCQNIISVMATDSYDNRSSFSNYGPLSVDLGAPGTSIYSCKPSNQYQYLNGTSMATPHVAGACSLLLSVKPSLNNQQVIDALLQNVDQTLPGQCVSQGRLNLYNAIKSIPTSSPWLQLIPDKGVVPPGQTMTITLIFDGNRVTGNYQGEIIVASNDETYPEIVIPVSMEVQGADYLTELFNDNDNDLNGKSLVFVPNEYQGYNVYCNEADGFPVDPAGGNVVSLRDDDYVEIHLGEHPLEFFGELYESFYIGSNGYITFTSGDIQHIESLTDHFSFPRISALFDDLDPSAGGTISWKQCPDRIVITYEDISEYGAFNSNSFQIELIMGGKIRLTLLEIAAQDGLTGLSRGEGLSTYFKETDFSDLQGYHLTADFNNDNVVNLIDFATLSSRWLQHCDLAVTARDEFNAVAYNGNDGTWLWSSIWTEQGESDGPANGLLRVLPEGNLLVGHAKIKDPPICSLTRQVNLAAAGATYATLSFDYFVEGTSSSGYVDVEVSGDGGSTWSTLVTYDAASSAGSADIDISAYISNSTSIRFTVSSEASKWLKMQMHIDNVQVSFDHTLQPWYPWADGCDLNHDFCVEIGDLCILTENFLQ